MRLSARGLPVLDILMLWVLVCGLLALFAVDLLLHTAVFMHRRRLQFCAQQDLVVLCFAYFGIVLWSISDYFLLSI
jgi:hypothetical protein